MDIRERDIEYGKLWIKDLEIHPKVQREFRPNHMKEIARNFAPIAVNALTVVRMTSGSHSYYVIDGQHTLAVLKAVGKQQADCKIIRAKTHAEMEEIFQIINKNKLRLSPIDSFLGEARNQPGSKAEMISRILERSGLSVSNSGTPHSIQAAVPLCKAFDKLGRKHFIRAVEVWESLADNGHRICSATVSSVADVIATNRGNDDLIEVMIDVFDDRFFQIKSRAKSRCNGDHLSNRWRELRDCIIEDISAELGDDEYLRVAA